MKTTIELPDVMFRQAKALAGARGVTLKRFFTEALEEQLRHCTSENRAGKAEPSMDGRLRRAIRSFRRDPSRPQCDRGGVRDTLPQRPRMILDTNVIRSVRTKVTP